MFNDIHGDTIIQDTIPPEYAQKGYKIVNEAGITLKIVPSMQDHRKKLRASQKRHLAAEQKAIRKEKDQRLLRSFSTVEEIRLAGNKKIVLLQTQIETTAKHIVAFEENITKMESQSAAGGKQNDDAVQKIKDSIRLNAAFIERKRTEQEKIRLEYMEYIKRYQILTAAQSEE